MYSCNEHICEISSYYMYMHSFKRHERHDSPEKHRTKFEISLYIHKIYMYLYIKYELNVCNDFWDDDQKAIFPFSPKFTRHSSVKNHWSGTKFERIRKTIVPELNMNLICIFLTIFAAPLFFYSVLLLFNYICFILSIQNSTGNYCNIKVM